MILCRVPHSVTLAMNMNNVPSIVRHPIDV